jgi:hypothetical protein
VVVCFGHVAVDPDSDRITCTLPVLHFHQLALSAPLPRPGIDFDVMAAKEGDGLFSGKARCNNCHLSDDEKHELVEYLKSL